MNLKKVLVNYFGTAFDKITPLIVSVFLVNYIPKEDYAKWSIYYSYLIIVYTFSFSPLLIRFSKIKDTEIKGENYPIIIYTGWLVLLFFLAASLFYFIYFGFEIKFFLLELGGFFLLPFYEYISYIFRFKEKDLHYLKFSLIKLLIFIFCLLIYYYNYLSISYNAILISFLVSYSFIFLYNLRNIKVIFDFSDIHEFITTSVYGLLMGLTSSFDKFIMTYRKYSYEDIASFSYMVTLIALPSIFIETLKKIYNPIAYKNFKQRDIERDIVNSKLKASNYILYSMLFQLAVPFFSFLLLRNLGLVDNSLIKSDFIKTFIFLNFSTTVFISYHFINQYFFYFSRTKLLVLIQVIALIVSTFSLVYLPSSQTLFVIGLAKSIQVLLVSGLTFILCKYYDR